MLSPEERLEIDYEVYRTMAAIEHQIATQAGSYNYLCLVAGSPTFTHQPVGAVLRAIPHIPVSTAC